MKEKEKTVIIMAIAILIIAIVATVIYLCYFIDCKNINAISLIISSIFFSVFIILNFLLVLDYFIATEFKVDENELMTKIISNFYSYFNRINSIMTSIILPFMINCFETGYYSTCKIILESIHSIGKPLWKLIKKMHWRIIIIIGIVLGIIVVILYYMFKDKYRLEEPLYYFDYFAMGLNIFSLIQIYINVGYFMVQLFFDCKIEGCGCCNCNCDFCGLSNCCSQNKILEKKLYFYSVRLVIEKTEKYFKKITEANKALDDTIKSFDNEINSKFHKFLLNKVNLIKNDLELYKYENNENINLVIGSATFQRSNINLGSTTRQNNLNLNFRNSLQINQMSSKAETNTLKDKKQEETKPKKEIKDKEKESENILAKHIRKYKKATRRIKKLKNLYNDITKEFNYSYYREEQSTNTNNFKCWSSLCSCWCCKKEERKKCFKQFKYYALIAAFIMIVLTDIGLPIVLFDPDSDFNKNKTSIVDTTETASTDTTTSSNTEDNSFLGYGILLFLLILVLACLILIISCSYTIIMLYSMNKRLFISGDFLSGKKINDSINLMKTVKEICGFTFPLCYCNFYFWKFASPETPILFYENIYIPDYKLVHGVGVFMIAKMVVVFVSIIIFRCFGGISKISFFKNDLGDFNNKINEDNYNTYLDEQNFNLFIQNNKIYQVLIK